tara:strand:+ start:20056 stop:20790 length:735 start_codon:yes stop_codon:yes gene_type:complete
MTNEVGHKARQTLQEERLRAAHIEKVRERLLKEDLSALELQDRAAELNLKAIDRGVSNNARILAALEAEVVKTLAQEIAPPEATVADLIQAERDKGNYVAAENLERTQNILDKQAAIEEQKARMAELASPDYAQTLRAEGLSPAVIDVRLKRREKEMETLDKEVSALQDDLTTLESSHPYFEREKQSKALRIEAMSMEIEENRLSDSGDLRGALKLRGEVSAKRNEAQQLVSEDGAQAAFEARA